MRLIDADKLKDSFNEGMNNYETFSKNVILDCIDECDTAYDLNKIMEQLNKVKEIMESPVSQDCFEEECEESDCMICLINKAIKIVKGGIYDN